MKTLQHILFQASLLLLGVSLLAACSEPVTQRSAAAPEPHHYDLQLNLPDFMNMVLDPISDVLWDNAGWIDDINTGYAELYPTNDEEWHNVQIGAAQLIEAGNALALPGRALDNDGWITYSNALSTAAAMAFDAAAAQNKEDFFQAGAQVYSVCTACHQTYNPTIISKFVNN